MGREMVLIVEDDKHISKLVRYNLEKAGFSCVVVITGEDAFDYLEHESVDLIILDIMLPKMDGFEVCKELKQSNRHANIPIIFLTARGEEIDRIVGLELGSDDYIVKPFSPRELILRVKALFRRRKKQMSESDDEILIAGDLRIDIPRHQVLIEEKEVVLTSMEFKLLVTLLKRRGRVQSRDQLLNDVWDIEADVTTRTIDTHVKRLRQKLGEIGQMIETVRGHGYKFYEMD